jgi:hypothetical protein
MPRTKLTRADVAALRSIARRAPSARHARRAQALLELADGDPVTAVADRHRVRRAPVSDWLARLRAGGADPWSRLEDRPRSGRRPAAATPGAARGGGRPGHRAPGVTRAGVPLEAAPAHAGPPPAELAAGKGG